MSDIQIAPSFSRLIARIIDKVIVTVPFFLWFGGGEPKLVEPIAGGILLLYVVILNYLWDGQTVGKRFMKIRITSHTGGKVNFFQYLLRELTFNLYPIYLIAHTWVTTAWTIWMVATILLILQYGRGLHDMFGKTMVIRTEPLEIEEETKEIAVKE